MRQKSSSIASRACGNIQWVSHLCVMVGVLLLVSCSEKDSIPEGFERLGGDKNAHFVYVHEKYLGDKIQQRAAGKAICGKYGHEDYCEVYMWKDKDKVQLQLPIHKGVTSIGMYSQKNGRVRLRVLKDRMAALKEEQEEL